MEVCLNLSHSPGFLKRRDGGTVAVTMAVCSRTHRSQPVRAEPADSHRLVKLSPFADFSVCISPSKCLPNAESARGNM